MAYQVLLKKKVIKAFEDINEPYYSKIKQAIYNLADNPEQGTALGNSFYKIRLAIASKGKGKSGGARVITYVKITADTVFLTSIYDKSEKSTITDKELEQIFKIIP